MISARWVKIGEDWAVATNHAVTPGSTFIVTNNAGQDTLVEVIRQIADKDGWVYEVRKIGDA